GAQKRKNTPMPVLFLPRNCECNAGPIASGSARFLTPSVGTAASMRRVRGDFPPRLLGSQENFRSFVKAYWKCPDFVPKETSPGCYENAGRSHILPSPRMVRQETLHFFDSMNARPVNIGF